MTKINDLAHDLKGGVVNLKHFEMLNLLGEGGFGEVWKVVHKPTGKICALKKLFVDKNDEDDRDLIDMYVREVQILAQCKHLFLLRLIGFSITKPYFIVTPYIKNGSLYDYVKSGSRKTPLEPTNLTIIAMGVAYGIMKLHKKGIIHRDLKSPNILLDDKLLPYICDFGISRSRSSKMTMDIGTTYWMAPEQMESNDYNEKVDVYSYGCILYEMVSNKIPFEGETSYKAAAKIMAGKRPKLKTRSHRLIQELMQQCWEHNPDDRPSMKRIFKKFVQKRLFFDGTDAQGINAMNTIISQSDESDKAKIARWTSDSKKSHHHHH